MGKRRLTTAALSVMNLKKRSFRTKGLIALTGVVAFTIFCGALLWQSINLGRNYITGRMGADIMLVPRGCARKLENTLLKSESNTFFLEKTPAGEISSMAGVERVSAQLYIGSLNASCCTVPVQLIGFDPATDFTIKAWMTKFDSSKLGFGEVVVGSRVNAPVGSQLWLFGQPFKVAASIEDTGMGFDSSVFMTLETAENMIENSKDKAIHPAGSGKGQISALFIKLAGDYPASEAVKAILGKYPQTDVVTLEEMMKHISGQLGKIRGLVYAIQALLWIVSVLILGVVITVTTNERKREMGLLLMMGASRRKLQSLLVTEILIVSLLGGLCGAAAASFIMFEFRMLIAVALGLPYLQPTIGSTFLLAIVSLGIAVFTGISACIYSVIRMGRMDTYFMIREDE